MGEQPLRALRVPYRNSTGGNHGSRHPALACSEYRSPSSSLFFSSGINRDREGRESMSIIAWIVLGLLAGFIASKIVNKQGEGIILDIVLGIVGAIVGGFLFSLIRAVGVTGFNIWSMIVAIVGAIVVLLLYHAISRRSRV